MCEPCVAGVNYSNSSSPFELCQRVTECAGLHIVAKEATRTSDIQCVCPKGYVEDRLGTCHKPQPTQYLTASPTTSTTEVPTGSATSTMSYSVEIIIGVVVGYLSIGVVLAVCGYYNKHRFTRCFERTPLLPSEGEHMHLALGFYSLHK